MAFLRDLFEPFFGTQPDPSDRPAASPTVGLVETARAGQWNRVATLLLEGADPNQCDGCGNTALHLAAASGHRQTVALLLATGADGRAWDQNCKTPVQLAAGNGHKEVVWELVNAGIDVTEDDCLEEAIFTGNKEMVKILLAEVADVNRIPELEDWTLLDHALQLEDGEIANLLMSEGAMTAEGLAILRRRQRLSGLSWTESEECEACGMVRPDHFRTCVRCGRDVCIQCCVTAGKENECVCEQCIDDPVAGPRKLIQVLC